MVSRTELAGAYADWIGGLCKWKLFVSLTWRDEVVSMDRAQRDWVWLVRLLNERYLGRHYTRIYKHSYFSYVIGWERQGRGTPHCHWLTDSWIDLKLLHGVWSSCAGYAWTELLSDSSGAVDYVTKYVLKGGDIDVWLSRKPPATGPRSGSEGEAPRQAGVPLL